jgi:hypothetical protein
MVPGYDSKSASNGKERYNYTESVSALNYERLSEKSTDQPSTISYVLFQGSNACLTNCENVSFIENIIYKEYEEYFKS